ncbi:MAG: M48 family metallopeptidase [Alphaproteobacteria bacterium]
MNDYVDLSVGPRTIPLRVKRHNQAKRASLRIDARAGEPVLVLPPRMALKTGLTFVQEHAEWIAERLDELPNEQLFEDGAVIPFIGDPHLIQHVPRQRTPVIHAGQVLKIGGDSAHLARRLTDFLKAEAKQKISADAAEFAGRANRKPARIQVKDTRSRWGSCTPERVLSFSWRLILAPEFARRYVVAHECAHMVELNHSQRFWDEVERIYGPYKDARKWLDDHGAALHRVGISR